MLRSAAELSNRENSDARVSDWNMRNLRRESCRVDWGLAGNATARHPLQEMRRCPEGDESRDSNGAEAPVAYQRLRSLACWFSRVTGTRSSASVT